MDIRGFGRIDDTQAIPNLVELQTIAYDQFLQPDVLPERRSDQGLESIIREIFPLTSYDGSTSLEYLGYELGVPRYTPDECRQLKQTFGVPLKLRLRLNKAEPVEEEVYLGEIPLMIGGGEFIINGAERVIVSQLHRSPGIDFMEERTGDLVIHSCWIVPERGSWIEIAVGKKESLSIRIDQGGKIPATIFLRATDPRYSTDTDIIRVFYDTQVIKVNDKFKPQLIIGKFLAADIIDPEQNEVYAAVGSKLTDTQAERLHELGVKEVEVITNMHDEIILNTLAEDPTATHEEALLKIYARLRPGTPQQLERARTLFQERFFDPTRYRLGRVGRFRLNRKFGTEMSEDQMVLQKEDIVNAIHYLVKMRKGEGIPDDIDHLGNRRVRTIEELAGEEIRKGFLRLARSIQERLNLDTIDKMTPKSLINSKTVSSAIDYFFGRSELSQVVDQTNPLSQLTHERRLSALGPGGLNRKRAGFEVRDVHISHYGRICPIETPEGTNIGLISSLGIFAQVDPYGFLTTPYRVIRNGRVLDEVVHLRADAEIRTVMGPADLPVDSKGNIIGDRVLARIDGEFQYYDPHELQYMDISPKQIVGVSAGLIPFLEHDDANRALMGSNMQRQAVPLLQTEAPLVGTGMEEIVASNSSMVITAKKAGTVKYVDATKIIIGDDVYHLRKYVGLNERTCLNQRPIVDLGEAVEQGQVIADGAATDKGTLALGRNVLVAFMPWGGYNYEDAIIVSETLIKNDKYTSIHIEEFEIEIRETKLGREEFTRDIPNVSERALRNLTEEGVVRVGTFVRSGDILVGKVSPKSKSELTPEEKLLHAIFGRAGEDVKNDSLEIPSGVEGIVVDTQKFSRKVRISDSEKKKIRETKRELEAAFVEEANALLDTVIEKVKPLTKRGALPKTTRFGANGDLKTVQDLRDRMHPFQLELDGDRRSVDSAESAILDLFQKVEELENEKDKRISRLERGDELPTGVLEMVKVYVATKRTLSVGDKMAGRHGNKGVISKILPEEDMPYLADGTPVEIILNPLGVPSRMNVGQILETHLGWAALKLGFRAQTPVFDGAHESVIEDLLEEAGLPRDGKVDLYDGRSGRQMDEQVTVGIIYMLKLHHLVDDKVHARATGPYSLITQQPLGGKARAGGQRFGEMEVWALEAYGAANILQELLTVKSDDVDGRTKIYESMVRGDNILEPGTPVSFEVLTNEIKGLCLNLRLEKSREF